jgi:hypothetical protein
MGESDQATGVPSMPMPSHPVPLWDVASHPVLESRGTAARRLPPPASGPTFEVGYAYPPDLGDDSIGFQRRAQSLIRGTDEEGRPVAECHSAVMTRPIEGEAFSNVPLITTLAFVVKLSEVANCTLEKLTKVTAKPGFVAHSLVSCKECGRTMFMLYLHDHDNSFEIRCNGICACRTGLGIWEEPMALHSGGNRFFSIDLREAMKKIEPHGPVKNQNFRQTARYILKRKLSGDKIEREWLDARAFSKSAHRCRQQLLRHVKNLDDFIDNKLAKEGYVKVVKAPLARDKDGKEMLPKKKYVYHGHNISALIWIPKWAITAYERANYIQLDCSFRGTKPFAYCVPQAMIHNEAVPLGFIMTPRECALTYTMIMEELWDFKPEELAPKPVLSDQGGGLCKFCTDHEIPQFFCHRHLIELFGAASTAGMLAARVLRIQKKKNFEKVRDQFIEDAKALHAKEQMSKHALDQFTTWLRNFRDGLWERDGAGIARCSNHAERFHGIVNQAIRRAGKRALTERLDILRQVIDDRRSKYQSGWRDQMNRTCAALRDMKLEQRDECNDAECVEYRRMMRVRYGVDYFPCPHTVGQYTPIRPDFPSIDNAENERLVWDRAGGVTHEVDLLTLNLTAEENAQLTPKNSGTPPPKAVIRWDDEIDTTCVADCVAEPEPDDPDALVARDIVVGVFELRFRERDLPRIDRINASHQILAHFEAAYAQATTERHLNARRNARAKRKWLAEYSVRWWHWAKTGEDCPMPEHVLLAEPGSRGSEELIPPVGPAVRYDPEDY